MKPSLFQKLLLSWFDACGRKHLPWQKDKTPYRVYVSEIMLQQTQVSTVIPYFERFINRFPDIMSLANAIEEEVMYLWAGLGYYSRARNLLRTAQIIATEYQGKFPSTLAELETLPGIGQSTAGAILSIAYSIPTPILDGNVKRVLSRFAGIKKPITERKTQDELWQLATSLTPSKRVADYTQAMMDLGATICLRSRPKCNQCPLMKYCIANQLNLTATIPAKTVKAKIPTREASFLIVQTGHTVLLCKRPSQGIWGGLWSLPELPGAPNETKLREFCHARLKIAPTDFEPMPSFRHTFTHYHLLIHPFLMVINKKPAGKVMAGNSQIWYNHKQIKQALGLPKPVQMILKGLT